VALWSRGPSRLRREEALRRFRQRPLPERVPCGVAFMPHACCPSDERCYEPGRSPSGADTEDRGISPTGSCSAPSF
jgi:hypothetical protein